MALLSSSCQATDPGRASSTRCTEAWTLRGNLHVHVHYERQTPPAYFGAGVFPHGTEYLCHLPTCGRLASADKGSEQGPHPEPGNQS